jgi:hypothetical protein
MDPLSVLASSASIFDAFKEAYRFAEDVLKADSERAEFRHHLQCVETLKGTLERCIAAEKDQPGRAWVKDLTPEDPKKSPLFGLQKTMNAMLAKLRPSGLQESVLKQKLKTLQVALREKISGSFLHRYCDILQRNPGNSRSGNHWNLSRYKCPYKRATCDCRAGAGGAKTGSRRDTCESRTGTGGAKKTAGREKSAPGREKKTPRTENETSRGREETSRRGEKNSGRATEENRGRI